MITGTGRTAITAGIMTLGTTGIPGIMTITGTARTAIITAGTMIPGTMTHGITARTTITAITDTIITAMAGMTVTGMAEAATTGGLHVQLASATGTATSPPAAASTVPEA